MTKKIVAGVALVAVLAAVAYAQFAKPEDAIKYRKAVMRLIVHHFGTMGAVVKGAAPYSAAEFAAHASTVDMLSGLAWDAFLTPGSDKGDTRMKPAALKEPDKFLAAADAFEIEAAELAEAADGGELEKIKPRFAAVAQACSACHKQFRK